MSDLKRFFEIACSNPYLLSPIYIILAKVFWDSANYYGQLQQFGALGVYKKTPTSVDSNCKEVIGSVAQLSNIEVFNIDKHLVDLEDSNPSTEKIPPSDPVTLREALSKFYINKSRSDPYLMQLTGLDFNINGYTDLSVEIGNNRSDVNTKPYETVAFSLKMFNYLLFTGFIGLAIHTCEKNIFFNVPTSPQVESKALIIGCTLTIAMLVLRSETCKKYLINVEYDNGWSMMGLNT